MLHADIALKPTLTFLKKALQGDGVTGEERDRFQRVIDHAEAALAPHIAPYLREILDRVSVLGSVSAADEKEHRDWLERQIEALEGRRS